MTRLRKADVEALLQALDTPLLVDALRTALAHVCDVETVDDDWAALVRLSGHRGGWSDQRVTELVGREPEALADLAIEMNELRDVRPFHPQ